MGANMTIEAEESPRVEGASGRKWTAFATIIGLALLLYLTRQTL